MPDYDIPRITLRYNGIFDFDGFYNAVTDWAKNYGFMWHESSFKHKVPSPEGAEQELAWQMTKKVTEFIEYTIIFTIHMWEEKVWWQQVCRIVRKMVDEITTYESS